MSRGGIYSYAYDNIGNRTTSREGTDSLPTTYVANRLNQYTDITEGTEPPFVPTYDADGNQTKIQTSTGEWEAAYNALNQAVSFTQGDRRIECVYDYLNRRVEKSVYEGEALMSRRAGLSTRVTCKSRNWMRRTLRNPLTPSCVKRTCGIPWNR